MLQGYDVRAILDNALPEQDSHPPEMHCPFNTDASISLAINPGPHTNGDRFVEEDHNFKLSEKESQGNTWHAPISQQQMTYWGMLCVDVEPTSQANGRQATNSRLCA